MAVVAVWGTASGDVAPDRVHLVLVLEALVATAETALGDLAARSATLDGVLDGSGGTVFARRPSTVHVAPRQEYAERGPVVRGHAAVRQLDVELRAAPGDGGPSPGDLIHRAVAEAGARLVHTDWTVDDANPARAALRAAATVEARFALLPVDG